MQALVDTNLQQKQFFTSNANLFEIKRKFEILKAYIDEHPKRFSHFLSLIRYLNSSIERIGSIAEGTAFADKKDELDHRLQEQNETISLLNSKISILFNLIRPEERTPKVAA